MTTTRRNTEQIKQDRTELAQEFSTDTWRRAPSWARPNDLAALVADGTLERTVRKEWDRQQDTMAHRISVEQALKNAGTDLLTVLEESVMDTDVGGFPTTCSEGCKVESDGTCDHGFPSVLRAEGMI